MLVSQTIPTTAYGQTVQIQIVTDTAGTITLGSIPITPGSYTGTGRGEPNLWSGWQTVKYTIPTSKPFQFYNLLITLAGIPVNYGYGGNETQFLLSNVTTK